MKFTTKPVKASAEVKKPAEALEALSDSEFIALMTVLDDKIEQLDAVESLKDAEPWEVAESFEALNAAVKAGVIDDVALESLAKTTPGLTELYGDSLESFKTNLDKQTASMEGVLDGTLGDFNVGPIGAIIALSRSSVAAVKEQLKICRQKLKDTSDKDIEKRTQQMLIRVRSKYLPSVATFATAISALDKLFKAAASNPKASGNDLAKTLKGSMYWDDQKQVKQGNQDTNWKYVLIRNIPTIAGLVPGVGGPAAVGASVAERFYFEPSQPVGERGWNKRAVFEKGLTGMEMLTKSLDAAVAKADKNMGADAAQLVKWAEKEYIYLGRGLTTAIRKMYAGNFVRLISNRVIH